MSLATTTTRAALVTLQVSWRVRPLGRLCQLWLDVLNPSSRSLSFSSRTKSILLSLWRRKESLSTLRFESKSNTA